MTTSPRRPGRSRHRYLLLAVLALGAWATAPEGGIAQPYRAVLYNGSSASREQRLMALTLAGIVNRDSARLYLLNVYETWSYTQTDEHWRDIYRQRGQVVFDSTNNIITLIDRFRPFIRGAVTYDPEQLFSNFPGQSISWQGEQAAVIGGLTDRLPAPASLAAALGLAITDSVVISDVFDADTAVRVPCRLELAGQAWNAPSLTTEQRYLTLLDWGVRTLLPRCNPERFYIREITDWAIRHRMYQVNLAGTDDLDLNSMPAPRADILERILTHLHQRNPSRIFHIYGWIHPEPMTQWFAHFGSAFHETLLANLSWHAAFPIPSRTWRRPAAVAPESVRVEGKYYLLFVGSEGDASNWHFSFQSGAWLSPQRGTVPIGWGWNVHLFAECPFVAAYYFDTASPMDGFLSVTSPLGYVYPDLWGDDVWAAAVDSTRGLIRRFGIDDVYGYKHYAGTGTMTFRGKVIKNSFDFVRYGRFQAAAGIQSTLLFDPLLPSQVPVTTYGSVIFNHTADGSFYGDASSLSQMASRIVGNLKRQTPPAFLLAGYQRFRQDDFAGRISPSTADISIPRLAQVVQMITADPVIGPLVEVVTPERFSLLLRKKTGMINALAEHAAPDGFVLEQNYPNPFNPSSDIRYQISDIGHVRLAVFDLLGREVAVLVDERKAPGRYQVAFNATGFASGMYLCRLTAGGQSASMKIILAR